MDFFGYVQKNFGWLVGIIGSSIIAAFTLWINKRRTQKLFCYRLRKDTRLFRATTPANAPIEVTYKGEIVENLRLIEVEFRNSGGKEIDIKDFVEPVYLSFSEASRILEAEVIETHSKQFQPRIEVNGNQPGNTLVLTPALVNAGDWFVAKILISEGKTYILHVGGRISGVREIQLSGMSPEEKRVQSAYRFTGVTTLCSMLFGVATLYIAKDLGTALTRIAWCGAGYTLGVYLVVRRQRAL